MSETGKGDVLWGPRKPTRERYGAEIEATLGQCVELLPKAVRVLAKALDREEPNRESMQAALYVLNRVLGTPQQQVQVEGSGKGGGVIINFTAREAPKPVQEAIEGEARVLPERAGE